VVLHCLWRKSISFYLPSLLAVARSEATQLARGHLAYQRGSNPPNSPRHAPSYRLSGTAECSALAAESGDSSRGHDSCEVV